MYMLIGLLFGAGTGGLLLFLFGMRGTRAGSRPHCAECGYDVGGLDSVSRCPECGGDLYWRRLRLGHFRKRALHAWAGLAILITCWAGAARLGYAFVVQGATTWQVRPSSWLLSDSRSANEKVAGKAVQELARRSKAGELPASDVAALARQALQFRDNGSPCDVWHREYGDILDEAMRQHLLSEEESERYWLQGVGLEWSVVSDSASAPGCKRVAVEWKPYWGSACPLAYEVRLLDPRALRRPYRNGPPTDATIVLWYASPDDPVARLEFRVDIFAPGRTDAVATWNGELMIDGRKECGGSIGFGNRGGYASIE